MGNVYARKQLHGRARFKNVECRIIFNNIQNLNKIRTDNTVRTFYDYCARTPRTFIFTTRSFDKYLLKTEPYLMRRIRGLLFTGNLLQPLIHRRLLIYRKLYFQNARACIIHYTRRTQ